MLNDPNLEAALADLDSGDLAQKMLALQRLSLFQDARIAPKVIPLLLDHNNPGIRRLAADVLGKNGGSAAVPALIDALYDEETGVRLAAAQALGEIGDPRAVTELIMVLDKAEDHRLAMTAAKALEKIGTPEALAAIQHLWEMDHYDYTVPDDLDATLRHIPRNQLDEFFQEQDAAADVTRPSLPIPQENPVQFSSYAPREVMPNVWQPLRAYVFRSSAAEAVAADAARELGSLLDDYRQVERPAQTSIAQGALIVATPQLTGFQFNPPSAQVAFYDDFERFDFKLRAVNAPLDQSGNGRITFTVAGVIVADVPLSVYVGASAPAPTQNTTTSTRPVYEAIFCSYSRQDTQIVEHVERAYKALGLNFLRDVETLKSGQDWSEELLKLIAQADIFQLFWSPAAAASEAVHKEWAYALSLKREGENFIRPVYWQQPLASPPAELEAINFAYEPDLSKP